MRGQNPLKDNFGGACGSFICDFAKHNAHVALAQANATKCQLFAAALEVLVLSGVGVKEYYRKLGYTSKGHYMSKSVEA